MKVTIDTTAVTSYGCSIKGCKRTPTYRHHKGCDNFIGRYVPWVAAQYSQYLDCCRVCDKHHMLIHYMYRSVIRAHTDYTQTGALRLRSKLIILCDRIIAGEVKLRKPSIEFVKAWRGRRKKWLKAMKKRKPKV